MFLFRPPQNLRHLRALSIADMDEIPMDLLHSFDQLKVLNVSGNHFLNTSLTLLDSVTSLEVSANVPNYICRSMGECTCANNGTRAPLIQSGKCHEGDGNGFGKTPITYNCFRHRVDGHKKPGPVPEIAFHSLRANYKSN